jgi:hypothetical protein
MTDETLTAAELAWLDEPPDPSRPPRVPDPATARPRFQLYDDCEIAALPTIEWVVEGILPGKGFAILFGDQNAYKTFLALDLAAHVCLGRDWHGRRVRPGAVLYVYAEGRFGILPRVAAWRTFHGVETLGLVFLPQRVTVNEPDEVAGLLSAVLDRQGSRDLDLIIIDTLNRNMSGNENGTEDMSAFIRGCDRLRELTGAAVLVVHHKGHGDADRARGSSALDGAADTIIQCTRDANRILVECRKQKDAAEFEPLGMEAVTVGDSLVLKPSGVNAGKLDGQRFQILRVLHEDSTDAGLTYTAWEKLSGLKPSSFNKARNWLKANEYVAPNKGKWQITDGGRLALRSTNSTHSTGAPLAPHGVGSHNSTPPGGVFTTPGGGVEQSATPQRERFL